jgi:hypothetical protein
MRAKKTSILKKIIGTLTLSILKFVYTLISLIIFNKLFFIAILGYFAPLLLENHIRIVAFTPNL